MGDPATALQYILKVVEICERALPADHPDLAMAYNNVGSLYSDMDDYGRALEYQLKAIAISEKVFPGDHPVLAVY